MILRLRGDRQGKAVGGTNRPRRAVVDWIPTKTTINAYIGLLALQTNDPSQRRIFREAGNADMRLNSEDRALLILSMEAAGKRRGREATRGGERTFGPNGLQRFRLG